MTTHFTEDPRNSEHDLHRTSEKVSSRMLRLFREHEHRTGLKPTKIYFSESGYTEARAELGDMFSDIDIDGCFMKYMGVRFIVQAGQLAPIRVTTVEPPMPSGITVGLRGIAPGETSAIKIVAEQLTAAQLCDIIMHWLGADSNWGDFEKALHKVVEEHGRFE